MSWQVGQDLWKEMESCANYNLLYNAVIVAKYKDSYLCEVR